jgi:N utilization substance protein A
VNLSHVIDELVEEKGLDRSVLADIVSEGMLAAYQKRHPDLVLSTNYNKQTDAIDVLAQKLVVASVEDEDTEISLRKARTIQADVQAGEQVWVPFDGGIGRIEILKAKQVIAQKIRGIESAQVYEEFKSKEGSIVHGVVHKCERSGVVVKIQDTFAFLPKSLTIPGSHCVVGHTIRALLKEVLVEPRNENQLILDRVSPDFLRGLFELEIPEVFERLVDIKKIARAAGYKSKIVVSSNDKNIDPVGTCVGVGGARIKPILRELGTEKIDIMSTPDSTEDFVKDALRPAVVNRVDVSGGVAHVWVDDDQRSLAIGKMGKNITLASELTGLKIELVQGGGSASEQSLADVFADDAGADENAQEAGDLGSDNTPNKE